MELPAVLRAALDDALEQVKPSDITEATRALSSRYRSPDDGSPLLRSTTDVLAYGAYRLPATYAAVSGALGQVRAVTGDWHPASMLDVGAGPGTASWSAIEIWPSLESMELIERDEAMIAFGQGLMAVARGSPLTRARWIAADASDSVTFSPRDLVIVSYLLGEMDESRWRPMVEHLWRHTSGVLVLIEPGTPSGFGHIRAARALLIELGALIAAPCPHSLQCPMAGGNWCHFDQRLARSRVHRAAKQVTIGYEDEKFSYVAVSRFPVAPVRARILRHPQVRAGHIRFELCTPEGLQHRIVSKRERARFREARHATWGSALSFPSGGEDPDSVTAE